MRVVSHHCQHICCGAAREAFMGFLGGSLVCHDGVGSGIAGMDRLENVTKTTFTARTRFRRPLYHSRQPFDGESGMAMACGLRWSRLRHSDEIEPGEGEIDFSGSHQEALKITLRDARASLSILPGAQALVRKLKV